MAQRRMIDRKITTSERVADLSILGALIYTWAIPVADDFGLLQGSPRTIKAQIVPMLDITTQEVADCINTMIQNELWIQVSYSGKQYYKINGFEENQKLRKDMQPYTILPIKLFGDYSSNWKEIEDIISKLVPNSQTSFNFDRNRTTSSEIGSEDKIREDKIREDKYIKQHDVSTSLEPSAQKHIVGAIIKPRFKPLKTSDKDIDDGMKILNSFLGGHTVRIKSNRQALFRLYRDRGGKEAVLKALAFAFSLRGDKYAPIVNDFRDLEEKWAPLEAYVRRKKTGGAGIDLRTL